MRSPPASAGPPGVLGSVPGSEKPLKGVTTPCRVLAWEIPQREEPGVLQSMGSRKSWT